VRYRPQQSLSAARDAPARRADGDRRRLAWAAAWRTGGSIEGADWLPYAVIASLGLAITVLAGETIRPARVPALAAVLLAAFGLWTAASIAWSPLPSLARDDALLVLLYTIAFVTPLVTLRSQADRLAASVVAVFAVSLLALATVFEVATAAHATDVFTFQRLAFPVTYWNGAAAVVLVGFWPALALSSDRRLGIVVRTGALAGATAMLTCWLMTQSKGALLALLLSGVVVLVLARDRQRILVPAFLVTALTAAGSAALTAPYRAGEKQLLGSIHQAGYVAFGLVCAAGILGLVYVRVDQRIVLSASARRLTGRLLRGLIVLVVLGTVVGFFAAVHDPVRFVEQRWQSFKHLPSHASGETHLTSLGSNRYDYYRVAIDDFVSHPVVGLGGHGWPASYLAQRRSSESPERSHSIELDALSETGIIGFLLLGAAGALGLASVNRRGGIGVFPASLAAAGVYLAIHASIDWVWSIPPIGMIALVFVGIGASRDTGRRLEGRTMVAVGGTTIVIAALGFLPPWLSASLTRSAYGKGPAALDSTIAWARTLDPLSVDPLLVEAKLTRSPENIPPLRAAVAKQPQDSEVH
jgi:O-antigen ligase